MQADARRLSCKAMKSLVRSDCEVRSVGPVGQYVVTVTYCGGRVVGKDSDSGCAGLGSPFLGRKAREKRISARVASVFFSCECGERVFFPEIRNELLRASFVSLSRERCPCRGSQYVVDRIVLVVWYRPLKGVCIIRVVWCRPIRGYLYLQLQIKSKPAKRVR